MTPANVQLLSTSRRLLFREETGCSRQRDSMTLSISGVENIYGTYCLVERLVTILQNMLEYAYGRFFEIISILPVPAA